MLAAINEIETDYGRNLNVSHRRRARLDAVHARDLGDATASTPTTTAARTRTTRSTRSSPPRATCKAAGADTDICARRSSPTTTPTGTSTASCSAPSVIGGLPADLVGSLTGLTAGPLPGRAPGDLRRARSRRREPRRPGGGNAADRGRGRRRPAAASTIFADGRLARRRRPGRRVVAIGAPPAPRPASSACATSTATRTPTGTSPSVATVYAAPEPQKPSAAEVRAPARAPDAAAGADGRRARTPSRHGRPSAAQAARARAASARRARDAAAAAPAPPVKERLFAHPTRAQRARSPAATPQESCAPAASTGCASRRRAPLGLDARPDVVAQAARKPARSVIGGHRPRPHRRASSSRPPHLRFEIRPAGRGAPRIDPKPILDGWKLLESTAIYRAAGKNPFVGTDADDALDRPDPADEQGDAQRRVLDNPRIEIYACGRATSAPASIDRRVLATLEFLAASRPEADRHLAAAAATAS